MENKAEGTGKRMARRIVKIVALFLIFLAVMAAVVYGTQWLWNWLVPDLFGGPVITYWQMLGLLVLTRILAWPWSRGGSWRSYKGAGYWGARWKHMTPEQRDRLKARMQEKWCRPREEAPANVGGSSTPPAG